ncbi:YheU family protein [Marinagarivorans algicola]|uniref:YheU family protein n=1 Tax=Marinagarivorans algicola TaxID=1513270 RepID=UPI0006B428FD|nr:YheU family protein [Marinagarivorans algicola]
MIIPPEKIQADTLNNILEEFINREGTDYGEIEYNLAAKVEKLKPQVLNGDILIVFDDQLQSITLMTKRQYKEAQHTQDRINRTLHCDT